MRASDGVTVKTRKPLKPQRVRLGPPGMPVAEQLAAKTGFADELPRADVHGAPIEFEREVQSGFAAAQERKDAIGNDRDRQGLRRSRQANVDIETERLVFAAGRFREIGEQGMMINQPQRAVGAAGGLEPDHDRGGFQGVSEEIGASTSVLGRPVEPVDGTKALCCQTAGTLAGDGIDQRPVAVIEDMRQLSDLCPRPLDKTMMAKVGYQPK